MWVRFPDQLRGSARGSISRKENDYYIEVNRWDNNLTTGMASKADMCRTCNRGLHSFNIPHGESDKNSDRYTSVKSPTAILHIRKKYRNPSMWVYFIFLLHYSSVVFSQKIFIIKFTYFYNKFKLSFILKTQCKVSIKFSTWNNINFIDLLCGPSQVPRAFVPLFYQIKRHSTFAHFFVAFHVSLWEIFTPSSDAKDRY